MKDKPQYIGLIIKDDKNKTHIAINGRHDAVEDVIDAANNTGYRHAPCRLYIRDENDRDSNNIIGTVNYSPENSFRVKLIHGSREKDSGLVFGSLEEATAYATGKIKAKDKRNTSAVVTNSRGGHIERIKLMTTEEKEQYDSNIKYLQEEANHILDDIKIPNANNRIFTEEAMGSIIDPVGNNELVEKKRQKEQENLDIAEQILKEIHIPESDNGEENS
jgi:hypothetical protein